MNFHQEEEEKLLNTRISISEAYLRKTEQLCLTYLILIQSKIWNRTANNKYVTLAPCDIQRPRRHRSLSRQVYRCVTSRSACAHYGTLPSNIIAWPFDLLVTFFDLSNRLQQLLGTGGIQQNVMKWRTAQNKSQQCCAMVTYIITHCVHKNVKIILFTVHRMCSFCWNYSRANVGYVIYSLNSFAFLASIWVVPRGALKDK